MSDEELKAELERLRSENATQGRPASQSKRLAERQVQQTSARPRQAAWEEERRRSDEWCRSRRRLIRAPSASCAMWLIPGHPMTPVLPAAQPFFAHGASIPHTESPSEIDG